MILERRIRLEAKSSGTGSSSTEFGNRAAASVFNFLRSTLHPKRNAFEKGACAPPPAPASSPFRHGQGFSALATTLKRAGSAMPWSTADGFVLDLQYVHERVIVMGFPADQALNPLVVNPISEVARFLETCV